MSIDTELLDFYGDLVQDLQPPRQAAPKLPESTERQQPSEAPEPVVSEGQIRREQTFGLEQIAAVSQFVPADD